MKSKMYKQKKKYFESDQSLGHSAEESFAGLCQKRNR